MLEYAEVINIARQLSDNISGLKVTSVKPPTKPHKFCWFNGEPSEYAARIVGARISTAVGFGLYVEMVFDNGYRLSFNDGVNARLCEQNSVPKDYQLLIEFEGGKSLAFSVQMYGGIILHDGSYDNEYYLKSKTAIAVSDLGFDEYFMRVYREAKPNLSAKAFLATDQRFVGLGNGSLQDILLSAGINPKRKISMLTAAEVDELLYCVKAVLTDMANKGGRDTEKDVFGNPCGYKTLLSKNSYLSGCPLCGGKIVKEQYLGGAVYYCPSCQPFDKN